MTGYFPGRYPNVRLRRTRRAAWMRRMVRETHLSCDHLIWPIFVSDSAVGPVSAMPGVMRYSVEQLAEVAAQAAQLAIPCVALFPHIDTSRKDRTGKEAVNQDNLTCRAIAAIKQACPQLGVMADVALDPYTDHGHDGLLRDGEILNDETVALLVEQAVVQARAGADIIAPSDMMDGRVGAIRQGLDAAGFSQVAILAYAAKYASAFYGPFRDAVGACLPPDGDKRSYQMDVANADEALREVALDIDEGADMVMVKPGMPYLDICTRVRDNFCVPVFAYQVSGEYAMLRAAIDNGWVDENRVIIESLTSFRRAGCSGILSYFAPRAAELIRG